MRSFADANGDGVGDFAGVRSRLSYLHDLGVDAIWFNPWYASPLADGGYDVADYRAIDPAFGTLAEAEALIAEALALGIRTIIDIVPNHVSDQHPWFIQAQPAVPARRCASASGSAAGGAPAATSRRTTGPRTSATRRGRARRTRTARRGDWYLHLFAPAQPDLNWEHPAVREEHEAILRFWFDRGAGGDPHRLGGVGHQGPGAARPDRRRPRQPSTRSSTATRSMTFTGRGAAIADSYDPPRA